MSTPLKDMHKVKTTYDLMSKKYFTHATPTLFNAGTLRPQLSSCYLTTITDDLDGIYGAIKDNVFSLLQGADARIEALDNLKSLALESELVRGLGEQLKNMMTHVDQRYQEIMRRIADVVENMADGVDASLQYLGMDEHQEAALQKRSERSIRCDFGARKVTPRCLVSGQHRPARAR